MLFVLVSPPAASILLPYYSCIHIQACDNSCLKVRVDLSLCNVSMRFVIGWGSVASVEKQKKETDERLRGGGF